MVPKDIKGREHEDSRLVHFLEEARQIPSEKYVKDIVPVNIIRFTAIKGMRKYQFTVSGNGLTSETLYGFYGFEGGKSVVSALKAESIRIGEIYKEIFENQN